jgi:hypothetical protein
MFLLALLFLSATGCGDNNSSAGARDDKTGASTSATAVPTAPAAGPNDRLPLNPDPPGQPVRLIFIHHSVGEDWLDDSKGGLGLALKDNNYFVSDANYGWGPPDADMGSENIGDHTDIGYWYSWFVGLNSPVYLSALYSESAQHTAAPYARLALNPGGENEIVMFKSCFPNSALGGSPSDPAAAGSNPLRGEGSGSDSHTIANAKGIYNDLLGYFATRQDKLFIVITAPPLIESETTPGAAATARAFNRWLVDDWLDNYPNKNVAVFDFYNVLTSNGGSTEASDAGGSAGNHHRYSAESGAIGYVTGQGGNFAAYGSGDSHPTGAGLQKATDEFVRLLNIDYHAWKGE